MRWGLRSRAIAGHLWEIQETLASLCDQVIKIGLDALKANVIRAGLRVGEEHVDRSVRSQRQEGLRSRPGTVSLHEQFQDGFQTDDTARNALAKIDKFIPSRQADQGPLVARSQKPTVVLGKQGEELCFPVVNVRHACQVVEQRRIHRLLVQRLDRAGSLAKPPATRQPCSCP